MGKFLILIYLTGSMKAFAASPVAVMEAEFQTLCTYDSVYCSFLKRGPDFRPTKPKIAAALRKLSPKIIEAGKKYNVDPRAIAGAILTENSLNVSREDELTDFLARYGSKDGTILGRSFSVGIGQINREPAMSAEQHIAQIEKRPARPYSEVIQDLYDPEKAVFMVAMILRQAQDIYKKYGFDIADKPEILGTLYNLGNYESRAQQAKARGGLPRPNYFGFFLKHHLDELDYLPAPTPQVEVAKAKKKPAPAPAPAPVAKGRSTPRPATGKPAAKPQRRAEFVDGSVQIAELEYPEESTLVLARDYFQTVSCSRTISQENVLKTLSACNDTLEKLKELVNQNSFLSNEEKNGLISALSAIRDRDIAKSLQLINSRSIDLSKKQLIANFAQSCLALQKIYESDTKLCKTANNEFDHILQTLDEIRKKHYGDFRQKISDTYLDSEIRIKCSSETARDI